MPRNGNKRPPWRPPSNHAVSLCKTCGHIKRGDIEKGFALATHNSLQFQKLYGIAWSNAKNHYERHVSPEQKAIIFADGRTENAIAKIEGEKVDVIETLKRLGTEAEAFLQRAKDSDDLRGGIAVISELRKQVALAANLLAQQTGNTDVVMPDNPAWLRIKAIIMRVLERHPDAKRDFLAEIGTLALEKS